MVRVNFVASLDGAITVGGRSAGLGSPADKRIFDLLRALADVVLVGHGTASAEGYGPITAGSRIGRLRESLGRPATAPIAVVSRRASLDPGGRLASGGGSPTILVTCEAADAGLRRRAGEVADVVVAGTDAVDPGAAMAALGERVHRLALCEGGPTLLAQLAATGNLDELCLTVAPLLAGGHGPRVLTGSALPAPAVLRIASLLEDDGFLLLRYLVER